MTPIKPRLQLRVGVTGHRPQRLAAAALGKIGDQLRAMLAAIHARLGECQAAHPDVFAPAPAQLVLASPLAAGADQIAAQAALDVGARLEACLPFSADHYRQNFNEAERASFDLLLARADRVLSLPGEQLAPEQAYGAVGTLTLAQCDLLFAIWDGKPAAGLGGTPDVIAEAVGGHIPVLMIDANGLEEPLLLWNGIEVEPQDMPTIETVGRIRAVDALDNLIEAMVMPPPAEAGEYARFAAMPSLGRLRPLAYPLLQVVTGARSWRAAFRPAKPHDSASQLTPLLDIFAAGTECAGHVGAVVQPRFVAADLAANFFALKYRGGFISNFVMASLAVTLALAGLLAPDFKVLFILSELVVISLIVLRTRRAALFGWHRRWIDTRHLAELLRILTLSGALGNLSLRRRGDPASPGSWPSWFARATARELGMPPGHLSDDRVAHVRDRALDLIVDQRAYHRVNAHRMETIEHWLRHVGESLFVATIIACLGWLGLKMTLGGHVHILGMDATALVTFLSALLPAVGAALYGIRMQGDFAAAAERSEAIGRQLDRLRVAIERDTLDYRRLSGRLDRLSEIMLSEIDQWRQTSEVRPLELPG
jgi:hypothetical protein